MLCVKGFEPKLASGEMTEWFMVPLSRFASSLENRGIQLQIREISFLNETLFCS
jgi:hypothetical protein